MHDIFLSNYIIELYLSVYLEKFKTGEEGE